MFASVDPIRKRNIHRIILVVIAALCGLQYLHQNDNASAMRERSRSLLEELEQEYGEMHRALLEHLDPVDYAELTIPEWLASDNNVLTGDALRERMDRAIEESSTHPQPNIIPYTMEDIVKVDALFKNVAAITVYDPEKDDFMFLYSARHNWVSGCAKLASAWRNFVYILRQSFPERFCGKDCDELVLSIDSGDYPHLEKPCIDTFPSTGEGCESAAIAPVLVFGSAFRHYDIIPNMIAMPPPDSINMHCFRSYVTSEHTSVCQSIKPASPTDGGEGLVFGEEFGLKWENLKPQVVWRGTDFGYLQHISHNKFRNVRYEEDFKDKIPYPDSTEPEHVWENRIAALNNMRENYETYNPRWQGVVLTGEAELEVDMAMAASRTLFQEDNPGEENVFPWVNVKFTKAGFASRYDDYDKFKQNGFDTLGEPMSSKDLAEYKYHIDLGGGGGTTWTGTIQKLAMRGLLFHHLTPTKDYIHDRMKPWVHYVPVAPDLRDLKEKFQWAEAHQEAAKMIADQGSALMRHIGTVEGYEEMFQEDFVEPLRRVIGAYQPVSETHPGKPWKEVLKTLDPRIKTRYGRCSGKHHSRGRSCHLFKNHDFLDIDSTGAERPSSV